MTPPEARSAWESVLDRLEHDVAQAARLSSRPEPLVIEPWTPPNLGPIPPELLARARALMLAQRRAAGMVSQSLWNNRDQQARNRRAVAPRGHDDVPPPAYVDRTA